LNLAAVKHVRSEKDAIAALHMFDTNVLKPTRLYRWLGAADGLDRYFAVSTDKAADPVNLMGASKRLMEETLFSQRIAGTLAACATTARFPNVAFSRGSLLEGFLHRLQKRQPLAYPPEARRYFMSLHDAADICLLAAFCAAPGTITVPSPTADLPLLSLRDVASRLLRHFDLAPTVYPDEVAARGAIDADLSSGRYPVVETPLDTTGEREIEHFVGKGEVVVRGAFHTLSLLKPVSIRDDALAQCIARLGRLCRRGTAVDKQVLVDEVMTAVPSFTHTETARDLDQRI
jgi:FlaA1/EpsC-like NDP-sugar epimerase